MRPPGEMEEEESGRQKEMKFKGWRETVEE